MNTSSRAVWLVSIALAALVVVCALALPALPAHAAAPPTNGKIAFESNRPAPGLPSGFSIYSVNPDGSSVSGPLVSETSETTPAYSPDGTRIAWATFLFETLFGPGPAHCEQAIGVMNADGSNPYQVANRCLDFGSVNGTPFAYPAWSPDGSKLAFMCTNPLTGEQICTADAADGSGFDQLTNYPIDTVFHPTWSPDGSQIAYTVSTDGGQTYQVHVMNSDGSNDHAITPTPEISYAADPAWSPDGTRIAFTGIAADGNFRIFEMNPDGSNPVQITPSDSNSGDKQPAWSPDGNELAFASSRVTETYNIWTMNADGSNLAQVTDNSNTNDEPSWGLQPAGSGDVEITDCNDPSISQLTSVQGNLTMNLSNCGPVSFSNLQGVDGTIDAEITSSGSVNFNNLATVGGNVEMNVTSTGSVDIGQAVAGGYVQLAVSGATSLSAQTGDGSTDVAFSSGPASMHVVIPSGAFDQPVAFTITPSGDTPPEQGLAADGSPATIDPVAGENFTFAVPTLNQDAQLTFTIDLSQLDDATKSALVNGMLDGSATIAVQGDGPNAVYQAFARCAAGQTPQSDGCVDADLLDPNGQVTQDPAQAVSARFDGVAGHFSNYAVALVTPATDTAPPAVTVKLTSPNSGTPDGQNGWFVTGPVQGTVTADDTNAGDSNVTAIDCGSLTLTTAGIGTPTATGTFSIAADGAAQISCTATDSAGNTSAATTQDVKLDTTKPAVSVTTPAAGALYTQSKVVNAAYSCSDGGSGLASCSGTVANGAAFDTSNGPHSFTVTAKDAAGNSSSATVQYTAAEKLGSGTTSCSGYYSGTGTDVTVPSGAVCHLLAGSSVTHDVNVKPGGVLIAQQISVGHDVNLTGAGGSSVCASSVSHDLNVTSSTGALILIGDTAAGCSAGNMIAHDLNVQNNNAPVDVGNNIVSHDLNVQNNKPGGVIVRNNSAGHDAVCQGNNPQTGSGNKANHNNTCPA